MNTFNQFTPEKINPIIKDNESERARSVSTKINST